MKRIILIVLAALLCGVVLADMTGNPKSLFSDAIGTNQFGYDVGRTVTTNDTALTNSTKSWADIGTVFHAISTSWSSVTVTFYGYGDGTGDGSPDGGTFDFAIYAARRYGGAQLVCSQNDATVGSLQLSHNPLTGAAFNSGSVDSDYCWVDTTAVTTDWPTAISEGNDDGANEIATLSFDMLGNRGIYIIITDITSLSAVSYVITGMGG